MIASTDLLEGHRLLADWLLIIAAVLFVVHGLTEVFERPAPRGLIAAGLALVAIALAVV